MQAVGTVNGVINLKPCGVEVSRTENMDEKFVYVLMSEWSIDYEQDQRVALYENEEDAKKDMKIDYDNFCDEFDNFDEHSISDTCASANIAGEWTENHCSWQIARLVVNKTSIYEN